MTKAAWDRKTWVSLIPNGIGQVKPNHYGEIIKTIWRNRDELPFALRILKKGVCDGCALGTTGLHDFTMDGVHLCMIRLDLMRLNTMPAMDARLFEDAEKLRGLSERQLRKLGRLPVPMVRRKGEKGFRVVSWDEAARLIASGLRETDPKRMGWYATSRGLTNEAYYAHQKVARFFGTNNVDTSARICHAPSTSALNATVGVAATTCSYSDWIGADLIVLAGTNLANNQPVAIKYLYYAKKAGTKIFVVNPYQEPGLDRYWIPSIAESALFGTRIADDHFQIHTGGDIAFFYGVLKHLIEHGWIDRDFIARRTTGWSETEAKTRSLSWEALESGSGLGRQDMLRFAEAYHKARHAIVVWSMGVTHHVYGSDNVRAIVNLQLATGNVGREHTGLMPIRGHSGVQGGAEMGCQPGTYLMGFPVSEATAKAFASPDKWGFAPPSWKGMTASHVVLAASRGEIDALWQSGGNFKATLPDPELVEQALGKIRLRVHQDIVANPTMFVEPAGTVVLLPARTRYEQRGGGTETSTERRVIYSPQIPGPRPGDTRDEWEIPVMVARKFDPERAAEAFPWLNTQHIRNEIDHICPTYKGISDLRKKGDQFQYGGPRLLADRFQTPDGLGHFSAVALPEERVPQGRLMLATRRGKQFNSIIFADEDPSNAAARDAILISAEDAARMGLKNDDEITLRNEHGSMTGRARIDRVKPGCLLANWPEANTVLPAGRLDASGVPDYNAMVEIVRGHSLQTGDVPAGGDIAA